LRSSLGQFAERALMRRERPSLSARELAGSGVIHSNRRDDQALAIRRHLQLGVSGDPEELEDRLVDDDARAVSDGLKTFTMDRF
jgi:hypothetical protein